MLRVEKQQKIADEILDKLMPVDYYSIIAGGAPRDWFFGKEAADIDVFLYDGSPCTYPMHAKLEKVGFKIERVNEGEGLPEHYKLNPHLQAVFDSEYEGVKVQFLMMREPTYHSVIPQFPLSICKAWYKHGKISLDKDFKRSVQHKVIVKTNKIYADENSYLKKVLDKFPEYKYYQSWEQVAQKLLDTNL